MTEPDWPQYEAIVEKRWTFYATPFARFARGSWLSWNWAAFFGTFAWLRYRKLYGWSWLYSFVSTPVLLVVLMVWWTGSDACARALEPQLGPFLFVLFAMISFGGVLLPLFANRIYYARVKALVEAGADGGASRAGTGSYAGGVAIQALLLIITAVAAPSYANYTYRARVSEGLSMASGLKVSLAEYLSDQGRLPPRIEDISDTTSRSYFGSMSLAQDGTIRVTFGERGDKLAGRSVLIVPRIEGRKVVEWTCRSDDLPNQCLPATCRK